MFELEFALCTVINNITTDILIWQMWEKIVNASNMDFSKLTNIIYKFKNIILSTLKLLKIIHPYMTLQPLLDLGVPQKAPPFFSVPILSPQTSYS